jgi:hypothetical protein
LRVIALDRDLSLLRKLAAQATAERLPIHPLRADAESPRGLPFPSARFGAVVVTRFLYRSLAPRLVELLAPGGLLVYETFTERQRELGQGPSNPAFLLGSGELPRLFAGLTVIESTEGLVESGATCAWLAGLVARRAK